MAGWGLQPWGRSPWGGLGTPMTIVQAEAIATRTVRVRLSQPPRASSAVWDGDALNPATWSLLRLDTGAGYTILGASQWSAHEIDVLLLEPLAGYLVTHQIGALPLVSTTGSHMAPPGTANFPGLAWQHDGKPGEFDRDVANPPTVRDAGASFGGTLVVVGGDYVTEQGEALARKMALRDLLTPTGAFAHLPGYGFGLGERVKQGVRPSQLPALAADIARVLKSRPWVEDAGAGLSFDSTNGILDVGLRIKLKNKPQALKLPLRIGSGGAVIY